MVLLTFPMATDGTTHVLIDTLRLLLRRWPLLLLALALAVLAGEGAWVSTPLQYQSQAQVLLIPPSSQPDVKGGRVNPFLVMGRAMAMTADIIRIDVSNADTRAALVEKGALPGYEVATSLTPNGGPILLVTVTGPSGSETQRTMDLVVKQISTTLFDAQRAASAPGAFYITASQITATPVAVPQSKNRIVLAAAAAGGALLVLLFLIVVAELLRLRRRRHRSGSEQRSGLGVDRRADANVSDADMAGEVDSATVANGSPPRRRAAARRQG